MIYNIIAILSRHIGNKKDNNNRRRRRKSIDCYLAVRINVNNTWRVEIDSTDSY